MYFAEDTNVTDQTHVALVATFLATIADAPCNAPIDTGVSCICIRESFYQQLIPPQIKQVFHLSIASVSGNTFCLLGTVTCPFSLGALSFEFSFMICNNLSRLLLWV